MFCTRSATYERYEFLDEGDDGSTDQTTIYQYGPGFVPLGLAGAWTVQTKKTVLDGLVIDPNTGTKLSETTSTYNPQGRLQQIDIDSDGDGDLESRSTYEYNDAGIRVSQTVETDTTGDGVRDDVTTTDYVIDNNNHTGYAQVLEERNGTTGVVEKTYTLGHDVISQQAPAVQSGDVLFLLPDGHGSTRQLVDATGQPLSSEIYRYDAYGNPIGFDPSAALTTFLYSGEQTDRTTGQQYLRARYYDAGTGRFNRLDPFFGDLEDPQSLHKYLYVASNPVNLIDPTGMFGIAISIGFNFGSIGRWANATYALGVKTYAARTAFSIGLSSIIQVYTEIYLPPLESELRKLGSEIQGVVPNNVAQNIFASANQVRSAYRNITIGNATRVGLAFLLALFPKLKLAFSAISGTYGIVQGAMFVTALEAKPGRLHHNLLSA